MAVAALDLAADLIVGVDDYRKIQHDGPLAAKNSAATTISAQRLTMPAR